MTEELGELRRGHGVTTVFDDDRLVLEALDGRGYGDGVVDECIFAATVATCEYGGRHMADVRLRQRRWGWQKGIGGCAKKGHRKDGASRE